MSAWAVGSVSYHVSNRQEKANQAKGGLTNTIHICRPINKSSSSAVQGFCATWGRAQPTERLRASRLMNHSATQKKPSARTASPAVVHRHKPKVRPLHAEREKEGERERDGCYVPLIRYSNLCFLRSLSSLLRGGGCRSIRRGRLAQPTLRTSNTSSRAAVRCVGEGQGCRCQ